MKIQWDRGVFVPPFLAAIISTISFFIYHSLGGNVFLQALIFAAGVAAAYHFARPRIGWFAFYALLFTAATYGVEFFYIVDLHIMLAAAALYFLWGNGIHDAVKNLKLDLSYKTSLLYGIAGFFFLLMSSAAVVFLAGQLGIADHGNIAAKVSGLPYYIVLFAIFAAPLTEELFFRAFLSQRIGTILSSTVFALFHVAYGSVVELAGAFVLGLVLVAIFRKGGIYSCVLAHLLYNLLALLSMGVV